MKLSEWSRKKGVSYKTAWRWFKKEYIKGYQMPTGTIIVEENEKKKNGNRCIIYTRVTEKAERRQRN